MLPSPQDFFFKQLRKVAVGDPAVPHDSRVSLLACSSQYGLTFMATRAGQLTVPLPSVLNLVI